MPKICYDPRHDIPCPDAENCPGCRDECDPKYFKDDTEPTDEELEDFLRQPEQFN